MPTMTEHLKLRTIPVRVTVPREHIQPGGDPKMIVDRLVIPDTEDGEKKFIQVEKAVRRALSLIKVVRQVRKKKGNKFTYSSDETEARVTDVTAATLHLHELSGLLKGERRETPFVAFSVADGRKYHVTMKGQLINTCQFCGEGFEALHYGKKSHKWYHVQCHKAAIQEKLREMAKPTQAVVEV